MKRLRILAAGLATVCPCWAATAADVTINNTLSSSVGVTDNVDAEGEGAKNSGALLDALYSTAIRAKGARASGAIDYTLGLYKIFGSAEEDFRVDNDLLAVGSAELWRDLLFIDVQGSSIRQLTQPTGRVTSQSQLTGGSNSLTSPALGGQDTTQVTLFDVSPYLVRDFGTLAQGEARYRFRKAFTGEQGVGNPQSHLGRLLTRTGTAFSQPALTSLIEVEEVSGTTGRPLLSTEPTPAEVASSGLSRQTGAVMAQYPIMRGLFLLGTVGYERIDSDSLQNNIDGPIGAAGLRFAPSPRTSAEVMVGWRYERLNVNATLSYALTPNISILADYKDYIGTVFDSIDAIPLAIDANTGQFINSDTGRRARQEAVAIGLSSEVFFGHRFRASVTGQYETQVIQLSGIYEMREYDFSSNVTEWRVTLDYSRMISRSVTGRLSASYLSNMTDDPKTTANTILSSVGLSYVLTENVSVDLVYGFSKRLSAANVEGYSTHLVTAGLTYRF